MIAALNVVSSLLHNIVVGPKDYSDVGVPANFKIDGCNCANRAAANDENVALPDARHCC